MHRLCESTSYGHSWLYRERGRQECLRCHDSRAYVMVKGQPVFDDAVDEAVIAPVLAPPAVEDSGSNARDYLARH